MLIPGALADCEDLPRGGWTATDEPTAFVPWMSEIGNFPGS
ncbi:hypothetical protein HMPREF1861_01449 [Corynebacterium kroppenstedtii]|nr:hypothetical protein HMPREF1861_01449 [Corynebacterium kroppenstedtii]